MPADTDNVSGIAPENQVTFWLVDDASPESNSHTAFVLQEAAAAVERFRAEGKTVLLHCVGAESRTPTVAALYGVHAAGVTLLESLEHVRRVQPNAHPNPAFREVLATSNLSRVGRARPRVYDRPLTAPLLTGCPFIGLVRSLPGTSNYWDPVTLVLVRSEKPLPHPSPGSQQCSHFLAH